MELMNVCRVVQVVRFQIVVMLVWIALLKYLIAKYAIVVLNAKNALMDFMMK